MNPPSYPNAPSFPLTPGANQPLVQHTTVTIHTDAPKDHIIWSVCSLLCGNIFCLGFVAFIYSIKARDRKVVGDLDGAKHYGSTARILNIISTVLICLAILSGFIAIIAIFSAEASYNSNRYRYRYQNYG